MVKKFALKKNKNPVGKAGFSAISFVEFYLIG